MRRASAAGVPGAVTRVPTAEVDGHRELNARLASAYENALAPRLAQAHFPPWRPNLASIEEWAGIRAGVGDPGDAAGEPGGEG
jgi:hypothetical protein